MTRGDYMTVCYNERFKIVTVLWQPFGALRAERFERSDIEPDINAIYKAVRDCMKARSILRGKNFVLLNEIKDPELKAAFYERWCK